MVVTRKPPRRGRRLAPEARRALLLEVAAGLVLEQGFLPLATRELAEAARVSNALIYRYFPEPPDLYNALLDRCVGELLAAGLEGGADAADIAEAYYRYVAANGPLIQIILRDRFMTGRVSRSTAAVRDRIARRLARRLRREFGIGLREAVASVSIGMTMPEECGRLAHQGDLDLERGAAMCRELVLGVFDVARRRGAEMGR
jgi:AcrR family transcriptional regulator